MAAANRYIGDPDGLKDLVDEITRQIQEDVDPHEMNAYRAFYKKHVSIFRRAYFTAYLMKLLAQEGGVAAVREAGANAPRRPEGRRDAKKREDRSRRRERGNGADRASAPERGRGDRQRSGSDSREEASATDSGARGDNGGSAAVGSNPLIGTLDGEVATLFVSIGKNRRVFPDDLAGLFGATETVGEVAFGQIKILDNYSFVEVDPAIADALIEAHNGTDFRGRKLTVNYARAKK